MYVVGIPLILLAVCLLLQNHWIFVHVDVGLETATLYDALGPKRGGVTKARAKQILERVLW